MAARSVSPPGASPAVAPSRRPPHFRGKRCPLRSPEHTRVRSYPRWPSRGLAPGLQERVSLARVVLHGRRDHPTRRSQRCQGPMGSLTLTPPAHGRASGLPYGRRAVLVRGRASDHLMDGVESARRRHKLGSANGDCVTGGQLGLDRQDAGSGVPDFAAAPEAHGRVPGVARPAYSSQP